MRKRVLALILAMSCVIGIAGCGKKKTQIDSGKSDQGNIAVIESDHRDDSAIADDQLIIEHPYIEAAQIAKGLTSTDGVVVTDVITLDSERVLLMGYRNNNDVSFDFSAWIYDAAQGVTTKTAAKETADEANVSGGGGVLENGNIWLTLRGKCFILSSDGSSIEAEMTLPAGFSSCSVSPDGTKIAYTIPVDLEKVFPMQIETTTDENDLIEDVIIGDEDSEVIMKQEKPVVQTAEKPAESNYGLFLGNVGNNSINGAVNKIPATYGSETDGSDTYCPNLVTWLNNTQIGYLVFSSELMEYSAIINISTDNTARYDELFEVTYVPLKDGRWFFTESYGTGFGLFNPANREYSRVASTTFGEEAIINCVDYSEYLGIVAVSYTIGDASYFELWNMDTVETVKKYSLDDTRQTSLLDVAFSENGKKLIFLESGLSYDAQNDLYVMNLDALGLIPEDLGNN